MAGIAANSPDLPQAGPYSHSIRAGGQIYVSGQLPIAPETGKLVDGGVAAQTGQSLANISRVLAVSGAGLADVVKCTVFLTDMADFATVNDVYARHFPQPAPARSAFAVKALPMGALVEIEAIAIFG